MLDVGTGSGVLALAALMMGVPRALAIDIDDEALRIAAENARINALGERLRLARGGPEAVTGTWPLVLANVLPGPLIEMAPALVRRVGHHGQLVLSGIPTSVEPDVDRVYRNLGMRRLRVKSRAGCSTTRRRVPGAAPLASNASHDNGSGAPARAPSSVRASSA